MEVSLPLELSVEVELSLEEVGKAPDDVSVEFSLSVELRPTVEEGMAEETGPKVMVEEL